MPCSICGKAGHNKMSCSMNPNSKKGKMIAEKKKLISFNKPVPLGEVYVVQHKDRVLGYTATKPTPSKFVYPTERVAPKKFVIKGKITRADIF